MKELIDHLDYEGIKRELARNPALANEGLPYDDQNKTKAHPLHRICDGVMNKKYTDEEAVKIAKIFLDYGADVNGGRMTEKKDTPLVAAASMYADRLAFLYIDHGADIQHGGCHGGTALHWAAWCGRDRLVERLIQEGAEINRKCIDFKATPLFWAVHGLKNGDGNDLPGYLNCVRFLIQSGADKNVPNADGKTISDLLNDDDSELKTLLQGN